MLIHIVNSVESLYEIHHCDALHSQLFAISWWRSGFKECSYNIITLPSLGCNGTDVTFFNMYVTPGPRYDPARGRVSRMYTCMLDAYHHNPNRIKLYDCVKNVTLAPSNLSYIWESTCKNCHVWSITLNYFDMGLHWCLKKLIQENRTAILFVWLFLEFVIILAQEIYYWPCQK